VGEANRDFDRQLIDEYDDVVFANEEEAKALTGLADPEEALREIAGKTGIAVVKLGARGSAVMRGNEYARAKAVPAEVTDTTAAGDYYAAGFLYGLAHNESLERCAQLGAVTAAAVIRVVGTRIDGEAWENIKRFANPAMKTGTGN
jgi:sugar/nucleoside kinase (ribokinase family)